MSGRTLHQLMRAYQIERSNDDGNFYARVDDDDREYVGRNLSDVQRWLAEQGEEQAAKA